MPPPLDLSHYIPVVCQQEDSKYNGKCFMEAISKVRQRNGVSISADCTLVKADFSTGDEVVIRFSGKDFLGVVDLSLDGQSTAQRLPAESFLDSPSRPATLPPRPPRSTSTSTSSTSTPVSSRVVTTSVSHVTTSVGHVSTSVSHLKRKRKRAEDGPSPQKKKNRPQATILAGSSFKIPPAPAHVFPPGFPPGFGRGPTTVASTGVPNLKKGDTAVTSESIQSCDIFSMLQTMLSALTVQGARLESINARCEIAVLRDEANSLRMSQMCSLLESVSKDITSLKQRQDMLFQKQDILQSTLAGEVQLPIRQAVHSHGTSSVLTWSPAPNSPPFPSSFAPQRQPQLQVSAPPADVGQNLSRGQYYPTYAPSTHSFDSHSVYSMEDVQSFFSEKWEGPAGDVENLNSSVSVPVENPLPSSQSIGGAVIDPPSSLQLGQIMSALGVSAANPLPSPALLAANFMPPTQSETAKKSPCAVLDIQLSKFSGNPLLQSSTETDRMSASVQEGTRRSDSGVPSPSSGNPLSELATVLTPSPSQTAPDDYFSQVFTSANLVPPSVVQSVFESKLKSKKIDVSNVGRFGVLLARCCFFGDDILRESTLKGKGNRRGLDPHKLESLMSEIHKRAPFSSMGKAEFRARVQSKVEQSLRDYLKPSGSKLKRSS